MNKYPEIGKERMLAKVRSATESLEEIETGKMDLEEMNDKLNELKEVLNYIIHKIW